MSPILIHQENRLFSESGLGSNLRPGRKVQQQARWHYYDWPERIVRGDADIHRRVPSNFRIRGRTNGSRVSELYVAQPLSC